MSHATLLATLLAAALAPAAGQEAQPSGGASASPGAGGGLGQKVEGAAGAVDGGGGQAQSLTERLLGWLHQSNTTAIQGGELAQKKGSSSRVKQLGSKVVADHTALEGEVAALAKARGVSLPGGGSQQGAGGSGLAALQKLSGSSFDGAFLKWLATRQLQDAKQAKTAQGEAKQAGDPLLSGLLAKVAPTLQAHAQTAHAAQRQARTPAASTR